MNLGLGNLLELKEQLLAVGLVASSEFDTRIAAIGKGVAGQFERYCNRRFERVAGAVDEFSADRRVWVVNRYPIETVTSIAQKDDEATGFVAMDDDLILIRDDKAGLVKFGGMLGSHLSQVRITYTGGYWFDTTEDGTGVMPAGATALPDDLKLAWYLQCQEVWMKGDRLGQNISGDKTNTFVSQLLMALDWVPAVKQMLNAGYVRNQIT